MSEPRGPTRMGELMEGFLRRTGIRKQVRRLSVLETWDEAVGERIARITRPVRVEGAVLFVEVRSSSWLMELSMMERPILERLNEGRDEESRIEKVRFRLAENG